MVSVSHTLRGVIVMHVQFHKFSFAIRSCQTDIIIVMIIIIILLRVIYISDLYTKMYMKELVFEDMLCMCVRSAPLKSMTTRQTPNNPIPYI